jgi:sugar phosphate isomerase/epimerase
MIAPNVDPIGGAIIDELATIGFDYIELSLRDLVALPEAAQTALTARLERTGLRCEACNNFFPASVRLTGAQADLASALQYARSALQAAARVGAAVVVFGSAGARNVPVGFPREAAWTQLRELLGHLGPIAAENGVTLVIEHLNRQESNILNSVAEAGQMVREVDHPHIQLLIDSFHFVLEHEDPAIIPQVADVVRHIHFARLPDRGFPDAEDAVVRGFFSSLVQAGYAHRCSVEAYTKDFLCDAARLRAGWERFFS